MYCLQLAAEGFVPKPNFKIKMWRKGRLPHVHLNLVGFFLILINSGTLNVFCILAQQGSSKAICS
jgi:hypothetical protein